MTKTPDLTLPLAQLTLFCGHHFTLIRAECWAGAGSGNKPEDSLKRIQEAADTVHNIATLGWHIGEYTRGHASGRALIDVCSSLIKEIKKAEIRDEESKQRLGSDASFDWSIARSAIEEICGEVEIIEILGEDAPTTDERMASALIAIRNGTIKKDET